MKSSITLGVIAIIAVALGIAGLIYGLERQERYECAKLAEQARQYPNFFYANYQKDMCEKYE
jgi:hypothetical protein